MWNGLNVGLKRSTNINQLRNNTKKDKDNKDIMTGKMILQACIQLTGQKVECSLGQKKFGTLFIPKYPLYSLHQWLWLLL